MTEITSDIFNNSMLEFSQALGADLSSANTMAFNKRYSAITLNRALLTHTYAEEGICQVLIDQPIDDGFRGGIEIKSKELSVEDIAELNAEIERMDIIQVYSLGLKWMRLFGGAGIIINSGQDASNPFDINKVKSNSPIKFIAADRWELNYVAEGQSILDQLYTPTTERPYNYYGHPIHKTNVIKLSNKIAPSLIRGQFSGWGMSELEKIVRSFNQYLKHQSVTFELLDEAKLDIMKIAGFNAAVATSKGAQKTANRVGIASQVKNFQNALIMDKEDEYEQKTLNFGGLAEILNQIRIGLACDLRMPMTKLFGVSPTGLGDSSEAEIENYNSMIESEIRSKVKGGLIQMLKIVCKKLFDYIPEDLSFEFKPLREQNAKDVSLIKTDELNRIITAFTNGLITSENAVDSINAAKIFPTEIKSSEAFDLEEITNLSPDGFGDTAATQKSKRGG